MSLEQQIEEAWRRSPLNTLGRPAGESFKAGAKAGIEIGRREALRELYVEVEPEDVKPDTTYIFMTNGIVQERRVVLIELLDLLARESDKIYRLNLPSPSAVFGGGA